MRRFWVMVAALATLMSLVTGGVLGPSAAAASAGVA
ncbi:MAG: hypothetical protein QG597_2331, partial [Actinomycetota bacterium]|nr:hypothetical protein [Actinomycetota bacterium]